MKWNTKFSYPKSTRSLINGSRHYSLDGSNLPSVTTILSATKSEEDKAAIQLRGEIKILWLEEILLSQTIKQIINKY